MRKMMISAAAFLLSAVMSGCGIYMPDKYSKAVDPYQPVNDEDVRSGECTIEVGDEVNISGQGAWFGENNDILISKGGIYNISGNLSGGINVETQDIVKLVFVNADISNDNGYAVTSSSERLILCSDGESKLKGSGGDYGNAVYSGGSVIFSGTGSLDIDGGIFSQGKIQFGRNVSTFCEILKTDTGELIPGLLSIN
ncbi:MAG: carbohydrate-binding domain-containing protein [Ruminiclostridium sp.]|nr:carbohydrate-binding domain-containing protein [Ruminiclostridium sp.]